MSSSLDLLRMLEPAVRPVDGGGASSGRLPVEDQSFESLLMDARSAAEVGGEDKAAELPKVDPLSPLASLDAIESASLRDLIGRQRGGTGGHPVESKREV